MTLGDKIRTIRKMKGLSQENLAEMLKISSTAYAKIKRNETNPSNSRIDQIANALNMNRVDLEKFGENGVFYLNESNNNNSNSIFVTSSSGSITEYPVVIARLEAENTGLKNENEQLKKIISLLEEKSK
jgi:transcriptional regulator with XRE-family HTH domain